MRVAIIGNYPVNSNQIRGGVQAAFVYLVKGLSQFEDLQLHILTRGRQEILDQHLIRKYGVILHSLPPLARFEMARNYRTYQAYINDMLAQLQPDVVHVQDAVGDAYVALRSGYPTVITVHGVRREDGKYQGSLYRRMHNLIRSLWIERYNLKHTRHLIAISRYVTDYFSPYLRPDAQIYYVPNAIDDSFFELTDTSNGHTLFFAGRVIPRKRVLDLVQAFARIVEDLPVAQLRIAGEFNSEPAYVEQVQSFIQDARLENHVHLLGELSEAEVLGEYAGCDVLVLPSAQETAPMVIAQAMAARKPVVATPVGGVAEMVKNEETGFLVDVGDVEGLARALLQLLQSPSLRVKMGQSGHKYAMENYHMDTVARRTHNVYQRISATEVTRL